MSHNSNRCRTRPVPITEPVIPELARNQSVRLSVAKAAERADVSPRTIKRWISAGILSATRLPSPGGKGHLRIRLGDLEGLLSRGILK